MSDFVDPLKEPLAYDRDKRSATDQFAEDWYEKALDAEREADAERAAAKEGKAEEGENDEDEEAGTP